LYRHARGDPQGHRRGARPQRSVGSNARFESHYPGWTQHYDVERILTEMHEANVERWSA
jgi:hypothetical protein